MKQWFNKETLCVLGDNRDFPLGGTRQCQKTRKLNSSQAQRRLAFVDKQFTRANFHHGAQ